MVKDKSITYTESRSLTLHFKIYKIDFKVINKLAVLPFYGKLCLVDKIEQ